MKPDIRNRRRRLNSFYKIIDKQGQSIVFKLNKAQEDIYDLEKKHKRIIILKARQLWMSTFKLIDWLDKCIFYKNQTITITAHKIDKQRELFQKVKYAYEQIPTKITIDNKIRHKPTPKYDSVNELYFPHNNSRIKVSLDSRSWTPTSLHITELAFRQDAREMMTGTLPSMPKDAPITIETTANWVWNYFYEFWNKSKATKIFHCVFIPRRTDNNYRLKLLDGERLKLPSKLEHLNNLNIDKEQKNRYIKQYELLGREVFQEFPSTPEEAFLSTGNPVVETKLVKWLPELGYDEINQYPWLRIYRKPTDDLFYFWVDTAEWWINWDYSAISVRDRDLKLYAFYYAHIPPDELCKVIDYLWNIYTSTNIGIERNNTGIATITKAKEYVWYNYIYWEQTIDKITNKRTKKIGRHTNLKTRPKMISDYEEAIRTGLLIEIDERLRSELYSFVYNEKNRPEAQEGTHDDAVITDCICLQMVQTWI